MSYILNALRKSEEERQSSGPETLEKKFLAQPIQEQRKTPWFLIVIILVAVNTVTLGYFIWTGQSKQEPPVKLNVKKPPPSQPIQPQ